MSEDVQTTGTSTGSARLQEQFDAWRQWQRTLGKDPDDWQAFRRDMAGTGAADPANALLGAVLNLPPRHSLVRAWQEAFFEAKLGDDLSDLFARILRGTQGEFRELLEGVVDTRRQSPSTFSAAVAGPRRDLDPLTAALARGEQMQRDVLATQGELLSADEVAARLQIEPAEVERRGQEGMLLGLALESGETAFPSWQFTDDGLLPGLESVLRSLGVRNSWMRAAFFLSGDLRLDGRTPLEALLHGEIDAVSAAGAAYGEQVAS